MSSIQYIDNSERDKIFKDLKKINQNNKCIVCEKKPEWASINLSIFLCFDCSGKHRQFGPKLSLVRSIDLDYWTPKQILYMEQGGNQKFLEYMKKNGVISGNNRQIDWENNQVVKRYKAELARVIDNIEAKKNNKPQPKEEVVQAAVAEKVVEETVKQESDKKPQEEEEEKADIFNNNLQKPTKVKTSNVVFASKKGSKKGGKKIKAEKIDDFDWDSLALDDGVDKEDTKKKENKFMDFKLYEEEQEEKQEEKNDDFFTSSSNNNNNGWGSSSNNNGSAKNEEAQKNFNEMKSKNTNAISSAALFGSQETSQADKQKFNQFSGSGGISSDAFFDRQTSEEEQGGFDAQQHVDNIKNFFWGVSEVVKQKAKDLNDKYGQK